MTDQEYVLTPGEAAQPASTGIRQKLEGYFGMAARGSSVRQETLAGITTFLTMVYSVFVVPGMFGEAGFDKSAVFIAVCLTSAFGSILMGLWANLPIAIGCAISLTALPAFYLVRWEELRVGKGWVSTWRSGG